MITYKVTTDFIVKLQKSKNLTTKKNVNVILVIVDKLTKYFHIIIFIKKYKAKQLGIIVLNKFIWYYKNPKITTSNRDKLFILNYWKILVLLLGMRFGFSIVYYSKING